MHLRTRVRTDQQIDCSPSASVVAISYPDQRSSSSTRLAARLTALRAPAAATALIEEMSWVAWNEILEMSSDADASRMPPSPPPWLPEGASRPK